MVNSIIRPKCRGETLKEALMLDHGCCRWANLIPSASRSSAQAGRVLHREHPLLPLQIREKPVMEPSSTRKVVEGTRLACPALELGVVAHSRCSLPQVARCSDPLGRVQRVVSAQLRCVAEGGER